MAKLTYDIATVFPNGMVLRELAQELEDVWPPDLFPVDIVSTGGNPTRAATKGELRIFTPRRVTRAERDAADDHFKDVHNTAPPKPGVTLRTLNPPEPAGQVEYVRNAPKAGGGRGCLCYSTGVDWRRSSDDEIVRAEGTWG